MFDQRWEKIHLQRRWGEFPSEHLVRFVRRHFQRHDEGLVALDLGCGGGAQTNFLAHEGFHVLAVDGSSSALKAVAQRTLPELVTVQRKDISNALFYTDCRQEFDLIVDVCTLQHLPLSGAATVVQHAQEWLKPGGWFFSMMVDEYEVLDETGIVPRCISHDEVEALFNGYELHLGHVREVRSNNDLIGHWIIEARKPLTPS